MLLLLFTGSVAFLSDSLSCLLFLSSPTQESTFTAVFGALKVPGALRTGLKPAHNPQPPHEGQGTHQGMCQLVGNIVWWHENDAVIRY